MAESVIMDNDEIRIALNDLALGIHAAHPDKDNIMLIGIQRRGADLAARLAKKLGIKNLASLNINLYRDDWTKLADGVPHIGKSHMPEPPDGKIVILVDDVLFSGRTVRAALEAILDYGRPDKIELLVLIDRGHRELPIHADYIGKTVATKLDQHVDVLLSERDGRDAVIVR